MSRLDKLAINPEGFVFDPLTGNSFTVNATGLRLLGALQEGTPVDRLPALLGEAFDSVPEDAWKDVNDFLGQLRAAGLLGGDELK